MNHERVCELEKMFLRHGFDAWVMKLRHCVYMTAKRSDVQSLDICTNKDNNQISILVITDPSFTESELVVIIRGVQHRVVAESGRRNFFKITMDFVLPIAKEVCEYLTIFHESLVQCKENQPTNLPMTNTTPNAAHEGVERTITWMQIYELSKKLIRANIHLHYPEGFTKLHRVMEFNTIRLGSGRQNGKTEFVVELADARTLVLVPDCNSHIGQELAHKLKEGAQLALIDDDLKRIKSPAHLSWLSGAIPAPKFTFTRVIIDEAQFASNPRKIMKKLIKLGMVTEDVEYVLVN